MHTTAAAPEVLAPDYHTGHHHTGHHHTGHRHTGHRHTGHQHTGQNHAGHYQTGPHHTQHPAPTHPVLVGYLFWILGFTGAHRFYFGKPLTGILWFLTGGLFLIGWLIDLFLIPSMADQANRRYRPGPIDHTVAWCLHVFLGLLGIHRIYMGKVFTGILYMCTGGLLGIGYVYDTLTLNEQIEEINATTC